MDNPNLDELKKESQVDNSKLEDLMKQEMTPQMQNEFFELLRKSQLFLPVVFSANMFEGIENSKPGDVFETTGKEGFDINYLTDNDGNKVVPLFTSDEAMQEAGLRSSAMVMFAGDLADMLKQSRRYSAIAINPFTAHDVSMPIEAFLILFEQDEMIESLNAILRILREKSVELEEDYTFYVRADEPFMKDDAVDGIFKPNIPFNISSRKEFKEELKYLNILLMPKTTKILFIGNVVDEDHYDTIVAPESEFEFVEDLDEFTSVWRCTKQPFYDNP